MTTTLENYCEMCQTLAIVCPDLSHPKTHLKQAETSFHEDINLEERCDICEARGCSIEKHSKIEIELKAYCRNTIPTFDSYEEPTDEN